MTRGEIGTHSSDGDAFLTCLDGAGRHTTDGEPHVLHAGESIVMPAGHPRAVCGEGKFRLLLVVVF